jgi:hypothetical protein
MTDLVGVDIDAVHVIAELAKLRDVHTEAAADVENAFGTQLDKLSNERQASVLAATPNVTGMAKSNRLGCRRSCSCQLGRSLTNPQSDAQAPRNSP